MSFFNSRPDQLIYHNHELHVLDLKVLIIHLMIKMKIDKIQVCQCAELSFGSVNDVMNWVGGPVYYHCIESCKLKENKVR